MTEPNRFRAYQPDQLLLMPPSLSDWLASDHLVYFIRDVVASLDLEALRREYDGSQGGRPAYDPQMMVGLLLYAYCVGCPSSRQIERATWESVPFRVLTADAHPDHDTIAAFRKRHLQALGELFGQVLRLCRKAGLVRMGHVALDGTKLRANASKHKAMSYGRMVEKEAELKREVERLLGEAEAVDAAEDAQYGPGVRGDELPEELRFKQTRLAKIQEAKRALEEEARARAEEKRRGRDEQGPKPGRPPAPPKEEPEARAQRNFTDPDSRIMKMSGSNSFEQSYNCQAAVDAKAQVIVAAAVTQEAADVGQVKPLVQEMAALTGRKPRSMSADAGYFSAANVGYLSGEEIDPWIATGKDVKGEGKRGRIPAGATVKERMSRKLRTKRGRRIYGLRKVTVEPVFGQIKEARGFRRFLLRGFTSVQREWELICLTHNLLKIYRHGQREALA